MILTGPQMLQCISQKMTPDEFEGHIATPQQDLQALRADRTKYYEKLGGTKFGVCLPGLGYDTFRMWELLTMGAVVIIEKAVGFDRTVSAEKQNKKRIFINVYMIILFTYYV